MKTHWKIRSLLLLLMAVMPHTAVTEENEERTKLPDSLSGLSEKELETEAGFDPVTGALNYEVSAHAIGEFGVFDFGNIRIAFRGWEMDGEHSSSHMLAFIYPRDRSRSGLSEKDDVHGGGPTKYTFKTAGRQLEVGFAETTFRMFNSYLDLGGWGKGVDYPGRHSLVRFTGDRLIVVVSPEKKIEGIFEWPKD